MWYNSIPEDRVSELVLIPLQTTMWYNDAELVTLENTSFNTPTNNYVIQLKTLNENTQLSFNTPTNNYVIQYKLQAKETDLSFNTPTNNYVIQ